MHRNRYFAPACRRGLAVLILLLAGHAAWASGFCDSDSTIDPIDPAGSTCHQVRSTHGDKAAESVDGRTIDAAFSYADFPPDAQFDNIDFTLKLDSIGLLVQKDEDTQMRVFELGVTSMTPSAPVTPGGGPLPMPEQDEMRALAFTLLSRVDGSHAVRIDWLDAKFGNSPSLNWNKPAIVLASVMHVLPADVDTLKVVIRPFAPGQWGGLTGSMKVINSESASTPPATVPFAFGAFAAKGDVGGRALYLLSGVVAGDLNSTGMTTVFDYHSPLEYLFNQ